MNINDLDNPDWVPDETLVCPGCETPYPFEWDEDQECWWPGSAEWWYHKGARFLCGRRCYLKIKEVYESRL